MTRLLVAAALVALVVPGAADAARFAVGARSVADVPKLLAALPGAQSLAPIPAVVVERATPPPLGRLPGARYVERLGTRAPTARRLAAPPNDPLAPKQWHLDTNRAFDFWETWSVLPSVRVAVIDSGIDGDHPEFAGRIADHKSYVGGSALVDHDGHGTFVAGLIAANANNAVGVAGMAPSTELLVAKVVEGNDLIDVEAEVQAIRWAVRRGARVINMSLGGFRDPRNPDRDAFSPLEADAVAWAHGEGVVVVAAVGNNTDTPPRPWPFASYPAALPHVLGVSAIGRDGSVPVFSHRDKIYNDIAAPGVGILSTFPRVLTSETDCLEQGYSSCAPEDFRKGQGTSFAAPQVSAAAASLIGLRPNLRPEQVTALLTGTARDVNPGTGCRACALRRDALSGWGRLDVTAALRNLAADQLPPRDRFEPNDDAGSKAQRLWGKRPKVEATLDFWDDQSDVYAIRLTRRQLLSVSVRGPSGTDTNLILWKPGTRRVGDLSSLRMIVRQSARSGPHEFLAYRAPKAGTYYVQVKLGSRGSGRYRLSMVKA
jgi:subtilisin family serine protease